MNLILNKDCVNRLKAAESKPHSIVLLGAKGSGKFHAARQLAESYLHTSEEMLPGNQDYYELSQDKAITKEDIAKIIALSSNMPVMAEKKVFLIDNADSMNKNAQNSLLKVLEDHDTSLFLFVSHAPLLDTVMSRCDCINFPRLTRTDYKEEVCEEAFYASNGVVGVYKSICEDSMFLAFLRGLIPAFSQGRVSFLMYVGSMKEKDSNAFFEYASALQINDVFDYLLEGAKLASINQELPACYKELGNVSRSMLGRVLSGTWKHKKLFASGNYTKNDFFEYLLIITKEVEV